jgi:hypothetical protein
MQRGVARECEVLRRDQRVNDCRTIPIAGVRRPVQCCAAQGRG